MDKNAEKPEGVYSVPRAWHGPKTVLTPKLKESGIKASRVGITDLDSVPKYFRPVVKRNAK